MLHLILHNPEIPQNTGNVGRMCALTGCALHLVHPLGFEITDAKLRRAGMDYWHALDVRHHVDWPAFLAAPASPRRLWLLTTKAEKSIWDARFADGDGLVFGSESSGVPPSVRASIPSAFHLRIPHLVIGEHLPERASEAMRAPVAPLPGKSRITGAEREILRSLNLSTACGIATYEALRQIHHPNAAPDVT
jgi:tRNA (cytidine/uridine-2'-O-)-methyltransferase